MFGINVGQIFTDDGQIQTVKQSIQDSCILVNLEEYLAMYVTKPLICFHFLLSVTFFMLNPCMLYSTFAILRIFYKMMNIACEKWPFPMYFCSFNMQSKLGQLLLFLPNQFSIKRDLKIGQRGGTECTRQLAPLTSCVPCPCTHIHISRIL